jgi:hypothetical protein
MVRQVGFAKVFWRHVDRTTMNSEESKKQQQSEAQPEVTRTGALDMQVCVPREWTNEQVLDFANRENLCGTMNGWHIRKQGDEALAGADERVVCKGRLGFVHVMLDA